MRVTVPIGTRPEAIKLAYVVAGLQAAGHDVRTVATGQHDDPRLAADVFAELGWVPDEVWALPAGEGPRAGALLTHAFAEMEAHPPDAVLVLGDTYTAPLLAIGARRYGVGVVHLEAGLRSFNPLSMEEANRRLMAALATVHLAPTELAASFLLAEGVPQERVRVVGNTVLDALRASGVERRPSADRTGVLVTAHRATNVDDAARLAELVGLVLALGAELGPVTFPVHPRTRARLGQHGLWERLHGRGVQVCDPLPYRALLERLAASRVAVTDSGGLQEEASWLGVPAVVLRCSTPRWEGVVLGSSVLTGLDAGLALEAAVALAQPAAQERVAALDCPYGDGHSADRVVDALSDPSLLDLLTPEEPDFVGRDAPVPTAVR